MSSLAELEALEDALAPLPGRGPGLDDEAAAGFERARRRIHRHHQAWRDGMPALDTLFDDDRHRARALAGNLCTQLEDLLVAWGQARAACGPPDESAHAFLEAAVAEWRIAARRLGAAHDWSGPARDTFDGFLRELSERSLERGRAALTDDLDPRGLPPARWQRVMRRLLRGPVVALRRFLRPDGG